MHDRLVAEWFRPIAVGEFRERIHAVLDDPTFTDPPDVGQRNSVEVWEQAARVRGDSIFMLDVPDHTDAKVEWDFVWLVYREFALVNPARDELSIGVIGYD